MTEVVVKLEHCRELGYCSRGIRDLFKRYNLDYPGFIAHGISSEELLRATNNDAMVAAAVEVARGKQ